MLVFRDFPNVDDVPANQEFRRYFYSRWGLESAVICARSRSAEYPPFTQRLSVKAAWGGREHYHLGNRTVSVDDDNYLVVNDRRTYASTLESRELVHSFSIFFRPGLAEETLGALCQDVEGALDSGGESPAAAEEFAESLRPHDRLVSPLLRYIAEQADAGLEDEMWYEEQLNFLVARLLRANRVYCAAVEPLGLVRAATRREIHKRIGWSTDYIHTWYMRPLAIDDLARSASLSTYHYIRLFRAIHGLTPFAYLQRKRAAVAARLLEATRLGQDQVAKRVGFTSRSTMSRHLRRHAGAGARALRRAAVPS